MKWLRNSFHVVSFFFKNHADVIADVCMVLLVLVFIASCLVLVSCKGTWSLENHSKVNGVHVDTFVNYSDSVQPGSEVHADNLDEDPSVTESGESQ